ncbi:hypothetical protein DICPUDRAFT_56680 [Dictyostelium purpureum]|uniref:non-specific serine/threonine protein kinase n=1 Tax=Dictyostelium purpureum TaxID=5786 RepID=F0ZSM2_DICPU|nr:uncharacterized protein DICPUDRAFT_56680 [Dictyostelium purpureum]EGC33059.1 hypothetical protein DICPUDRAFT_56680 [Dictyostelium purpureum]|eukprot:XP_003290409.1 hypothetical protein DICPUDRAFT_56680 [Dictyostelium purpureum]
MENIAITKVDEDITPSSSVNSNYNQPVSLTPYISSPASSSPSIPPQKKKTIEDFIIGKVLGEGSYGAVVLGTERETCVQYAIKILEKKHIIKENKIKYVQIEKEIFCKSNHPNIVKLFFTFRSETCLYYVLELCPQGDLLHQIKKVGSFDYKSTQYYIAEIISALEHLHGLGIVHRDLKPENILLSGDMHIKITDFGTASQPSHPTQPTRANSFVGTAEYVSPELISNKETSTDSDLWALGCIIYQLATGKLPFRGKTEFLTFQKVSNRDLVYPLNMNPTIKDLVEKLLVVKPSDRLGSKTAPGGFDNLKNHPFFEGIDWNNLSNTQPPLIKAPTEKIIFEDDLQQQLSSSTISPTLECITPRNFISNDLSSPLSSSQSQIQTLTTINTVNSGNSSNSLVDQQKKWSNLINKDETIVCQGLVWKRKGFSIKKRQLILTDTPRLIYIDPKKMEVKGEIPWSNQIKPKLKSNNNFVIQTPKRKYLLEDVDHNPQKWVDAIKNVLLQNK